MEEAYEKYRRQGLVIIGVNITQDDESFARDFVKRYKLTFPVGHDSGEIAALYAAKSIPIMIFIDKAGKLVERHVGALTAEELHQKIEALVK